MDIKIDRTTAALNIIVLLQLNDILHSVPVILGEHI